MAEIAECTANCTAELAGHEYAQPDFYGCCGHFAAFRLMYRRTAAVCGHDAFIATSFPLQSVQRAITVPSACA